MKKNEETQNLDEEMFDPNKYYYFGNSKEFYHCDPEVNNPKSIQNASCYRTYLLYKSRETGEWTFPHLPLPAFQTFDIMKEDLKEIVTNGSMGVHFARRFPAMFTFENFLKSELRNSSLCRKLNGRKVFYYEFIHETGNVKLDTRYYTDYAWVPFYELSHYFSEQQWKKYSKWMFAF